MTSELLSTSPLDADASLPLDLVAGRTYEIPVAAVAGEPISIRTVTPAGGIWDSILVLLDPDGQTPVVGSDDFKQYFAGFDWIAQKTGTYSLQVTSCESVSTGELLATCR